MPPDARRAHFAKSDFLKPIRRRHQSEVWPVGVAPSRIFGRCWKSIPRASTPGLGGNFTGVFLGYVRSGFLGRPSFGRGGRGFAGSGTTTSLTFNPSRSFSTRLKGGSTVPPNDLYRL